MATMNFYTHSTRVHPSHPQLTPRTLRRQRYPPRLPPVAMTSFWQENGQVATDDTDHDDLQSGKMDFWPLPCRVDSLERDPSFCWQDLDAAHGEDSNDFFGQFVDFDEGVPGASPTQAFMSDALSSNPSMVPRLGDSLILDQPPESIGSSTADEFDFLPRSSHTAPIKPSISHDIDPNRLTATSSEPHYHGRMYHGEDFHKFEYMGAGSISDSELSRLEGISLSSPTKDITSVSHPTSPTPPRNTIRKSNKFMQTLSSTIKKATNRRKPSMRKPLPFDRPGSPTFDTPIKAPRQRPREAGSANHHLSLSPEKYHTINVGGSNRDFIHGACEDPFGEVSLAAPPMALRHFHHRSISPPMISPGAKNDPETSFQYAQASADASWPLPQHALTIPPQQVTSTGALGEQHQQWQQAASMADNNESGWWDFNLLGQNQSGDFVHQGAPNHNMDMHHQQAELPFEYGEEVVPAHDGGHAGLMIHMPQPRPSQAAVLHDLKMNAQTHLPPPPPVPADYHRSHRPPRAPSSGARRLSQSPQRKNRVPSASPTRTPGQSQNRNSSGSSVSVSSVRSVSGRLPGSMPGTPCSVRKRRSRDTSGGGGLGEIGFVNFTPHDGSQLMTGVAPSGSSKTKARREKEALERRRRLSEAAIKAVAAAGGDVDKLLEQGFQF